MHITVIGLDLAKNVFQLHGIDDSEQAVPKRKLRRSEMLPFFAGLTPVLVGIEVLRFSWVKCAESKKPASSAAAVIDRLVAKARQAERNPFQAR